MGVTLVALKKSGKRKAIDLETAVTVIGRRPECDVRIPLMQVSRKHCRILQQDNRTIVQDLGSVNGTYINNERVMEAVLRAGDRLSVGTFDFTVQIDGVPEHVPGADGSDRSVSQGEAKGAPISDQLDSEAPKPAVARQQAADDEIPFMEVDSFDEGSLDDLDSLNVPEGL